MISVPPPDQEREKLRRKVVILFFSGLLLMAMIAVGIGWLASGWGSFRLGWFNQVVGPVLIVGGLALVVWSVYIQYMLGKGTPAPKVSTQKLVTHGPYAYTRNPMTLGALVMYMGIAVWMGSGVLAILTLVIFGGLLTFIYFHETRELTERFGEEYVQYKRQTPFLLPRCRRDV
jgi:protein-S-isoprenylcysteine O-methyltransferase Ste14